jgi:hypothetical protein
MSHIVDTLLTDLRLLVLDLGKDGGLMSPSVYDTAQLLRLYPAHERSASAIAWLLAQQQPDGGWGYPHVPHARDAPTLASILALHAYADHPPIREAVDAGLTFLKNHVQIWNAALPNDIPAAVELLLPCLLDEAHAHHLAVPQESYAALVALGRQRRQKIVQLQPGAGTTPVYSWEAWGTDPDSALLDATGSVGHSPAATAAWLRAVAADQSQPAAQQQAEHYLAQASAATLAQVPGVVPTAWPVTRYEQAFAWYALLVADLLQHPALVDVIRPQIAELAQAFQPTGLGFTDFFTADGDDTAAAVAVLQASGYDPDLSSLIQFATPLHFRTYPHELQASITTTARAVHALALAGHDVSRWQSFLRAGQGDDGRWSGDKWNSSWVYTTWHVLLALKHSTHTAAMIAGGDALVRYQHPDGGWGMGPTATSVETAYGVLGLCTILAAGIRTAAFEHAVRQGYEWLRRDYQPGVLPCEPCWINKELYCPLRIDRVFILCAMLAVALDDNNTDGILLAKAI